MVDNTTDGPELIRVSYSSLGTFSGCPRKFELDKLYPRAARNQEDNYAADVGKALHAGYQNYLIHQDTDRAVWAFMQEFPYLGEFQQSNDYRSFDACLSTLDEMLREVKMNEYRLAEIMRPATADELAANPHQLTVKVPAIEVPFEIRFDGLEIAPCERFPRGAVFSFIGYIDGILQNTWTDLYRTMDIKTSRMKLTDARGKYQFDTQQVPYGIVVDHVAEGAVDSFEVLYLDCYIDLLEPQIELYPFMKTPNDIQEWAMNKVIQFQQIARFAAADYFPRTENGCLFYNKPCRYLEPCQSRVRDDLMMWFTMGEKELQQDDFKPWITASLEVGGA